GLAPPVVAVRGNHDSYDGGVNFEKYLGPATYSFDAAGAHFVVMESTDPSRILPFLDLDLADAAPGTPVIGFWLSPPAAVGDEPFVSGLRARGVSRLFTGHWHQSRTLHYDGVTDYNMSPMAMGGLDMTPGGYRVVTVAGADVRMAYHATVERPILRLVHPLPGACVRAGTIDLVAAAEDGGAPLPPTPRIDGGAPGGVPAARGGGRGAPRTGGAGTPGGGEPAERPRADP